MQGQLPPGQVLRQIAPAGQSTTQPPRGQASEQDVPGEHCNRHCPCAQNSSHALLSPQDALQKPVQVIAHGSAVGHSQLPPPHDTVWGTVGVALGSSVSTAVAAPASAESAGGSQAANNAMSTKATATQRDHRPTSGRATSILPLQQDTRPAPPALESSNQKRVF